MTVLHELLDANGAFALDAKGTTNHCPMVLCALAGMGASPERLRDFFDMWRERYAIVAPANADRIEWAEWAAHVGDAAQFGNLRSCFEEWIGIEGADAVMRNVLGALPFAPATGAFHAIIRLAYALEADHTGEIGSALAAYVSGYLPIQPAPNECGAPASVEEALAALSNAMRDRRFAGPSITERLRQVAGDPVFTTTLQPAPSSPALLDEMARVAIAIYWQTVDFTALHMVTGLDAARTIAARLPAEMAASLMPHTWSAFCAAYATFGAPPLAVPDAIEPSETWPQLAAAAVESDNDHVIKMVYTCRREAERTGSPLYAAAAARLVRR